MAGRRLTVAEAAVLLVWSMGLISVVLASPDCSASDSLLTPCLNFVTGDASSPAQSCCSGLATVIAQQPICVCELLGYGGSNLSISYNLTLALELPGLCNVKANVTECTALVSGAPLSSPIVQPSGPRAPLIGGAPALSGASRKMPGTILSILQVAAAPGLVSLLFRVYLQA